MTARPASSYEEAVRIGRLDPAASAYGAHLRRKGVLRALPDPNTGQFSKNPLHDWASHGADAFRYLAVALQEPSAPLKIGGASGRRRGGWMGA